jgi:hypothetical protein
MMKVRVKALDTFSHGPHHPARGDEFSMNKGEAEDLAKSGLVQILTDEQEGDDKAAEQHENKMEAAPANKGLTVKPAAAKTTTKK